MYYKKKNKQTTTLEIAIIQILPYLEHFQYGDTALHTAARYGHAGVTRILISARCRLNEQNKVWLLIWELAELPLCVLLIYI